MATQISYPRMNKAIRIEFDEEGNQTESEVEVESGEFNHMITRKEKRGNRVRGRRGKTV